MVSGYERQMKENKLIIERRKEIIEESQQEAAGINIGGKSNKKGFFEGLASGFLNKK